MDDGKVLPFRIQDVELLTVREVQGLLRMSYHGVLKVLRRLPKNAVIRTRGVGKRYLIHAWALAKELQMERCPGCGREWPNE